MRFIPIVDKNANFYYFLHNIAKIKQPLHYRKWNIRSWKKELNLSILNKEEEITLRKFREIYFNHFPKIYLGKFFFLEKNPWESLKKEIEQEETKIFKNIFFIWNRKFNLIYRKDLPNLKNWEKKLRSEIQKFNKTSLTNSIHTKLIKFFNAPISFTKTIKIYLMLCGASNTASGERGRSLDGKSILLELSRCPISQINYIIGIIWHETIHCCFTSYYLQPLLLNIFKKDVKKLLFLEEIITRSLFPIGIFGIKFLKMSPSLTLTSSRWETLPKINKNQTEKIIDLTTQYIQQNKKIDILYIRGIDSILKI